MPPIGSFRRYSAVFLLLASISLASFAADGGAAATAILPPELPWDGASQQWIASADDPWITPAEKSGFQSTPT